MESDYWNIYIRDMESDEKAIELHKAVEEAKVFVGVEEALWWKHLKAEAIKYLTNASTIHILA